MYVYSIFYWNLNFKVCIDSRVLTVNFATELRKYKRKRLRPFHTDIETYEKKKKKKNPNDSMLKRK